MRKNGLPQNRGDLFGNVVHVQAFFIPALPAYRAVALSHWSGFDETLKRPPKSVQFPLQRSIILHTIIWHRL